MDELMVERVLRAVELVPAGRIVAYGDLAELVGTSARHVGAIMAIYGSGVSWWRVTSSYGDLPPGLIPEAQQLWAEEGILLKSNGRGCRIADHKADLARLAEDYRSAAHDLH